MIYPAADNLFSIIAPNAACGRCFDTGIWLTPTNAVAVCPNVVNQTMPEHRAANPSAFLMAKAARRLHDRSERINPFAFDLARILTHYSSETPCLRLDLLEFFFADTNLSAPLRLRKFHSLIEELRKIWLLPIGSRKDRPSGYWIITELDDFKAWFERVKAAPVTQLTTIHRVAKHNFPIFAEQMEFEFWNDFKQENNAEN